MSSDKPWDRPWSMEEIIDNSDKWSLAGDVALLNTLKSFAENLLSRSGEINNNLNNLTSRLDETSLQLNIAQNEFQSLRNTQFIESRVYEDDETLPQNESKEKQEEEAEPDRTEDIRSAAVKGLKVLEQYFERIEVSVSDSEDDDIDLPNYVLRAKDLYIDRPLPYVIGSDEWNKSWHVGLENSSSDSETEKVSDKFSESDSESELPIIRDRTQIKTTSDTSSEFEFSQKTEPIRTVSSKQELFHSGGSEDESSVPVQGPISNFAEELAAKLGNVIKEENRQPEINQRPIQKKAQYVDVFFDEPPPLDEPKGLFSGGSGLFDDDDDVDSRTEQSPKFPKKIEAGLFEDAGSDEDIFSGGKKTLSQVNKPPLFSEEPPALDEKKKPVGGVSIFGGANLFDKKLLKPPPSSQEDSEGEVVKDDRTLNKKIDLFTDDDDDELFKTVKKEETSSIRSNKKVNLFDSDEEDKRSNYSSLDERRIISEENVTKEDERKERFGKNSLFDDDDDLFQDDLFSTKTKSKFTSGLFDDDVSNRNDDLFLNDSDEKQKSNKNLFEDLLIMPDDKDSLNVNTRVDDKKHLIVEEVGDNSNANMSKTSPEGLFRDEPDLAFGNVGKIIEGVERKFKIEGRQEIPVPKPRTSFFDSPPPEADDLFSEESLFKSKFPGDFDIPKEEIPSTSSRTSDVPDNVESEENIKPKPVSGGLFDSLSDDDHDDLFGGKSPKHLNSDLSIPPSLQSRDAFGGDHLNVIPSMRFFDPVPPPDDEWETKSENVSDADESFTDQDDLVGQRSNLFSEEPPPPPPPKKVEFSKVLDIREKLQTEPKEEVKPNLGSPGRLKHNLNINVSALMPGSLPPKRGDLQKIPSVERSEDGQIEKKTASDATDSVNVLHSLTKDRVKVPLNRRPSTRRGRKAALKTSASDFALDKEPDSSDASVEIPSETSVSVEVQRSDLNEVTRERASPKKDLFGDDDDDDMFSKKKMTVQPSKALRKSLFDDDDTDDDIFKNPTSESKVKNPEIKVATEKRLTKVSNIKKLENTKLDDDDDDPLTALLK